MNRTIRHAVITSVSLAAAVTLTACGGSDTPSNQGMPGMPGMTGMQSTSSSTPSTPSTSSAPVTTSSAPADAAFNAADVSFATDMIPHHQQAVTMAQMARKQATNAQVKTLAAAIEAAQGPEITTMSGWLTAWGQPVPEQGGHDMSTMGGDGMDGMMTEEEMTKLSGASGAAFDRTWLQMMIKHHQGAVAMATTERSAGQNPEAKTLAEEIITAQNKEIAAMERLLPTISG